MCIATPDKEGVWIVAVGQADLTSVDVLNLQAMSQLLCSVLATSVGIRVESQIDSTPALAEFPEMEGTEIASPRKSDFAKSRLPQHGIVEQAFDEDHLRTAPDLFPAVQTSLGAR